MRRHPLAAVFGGCILLPLAAAGALLYAAGWLLIVAPALLIGAWRRGRR